MMLRRGGRRARRGQDAPEPVEAEPAHRPGPPDGPYDAADEPDDGVRRVDVGALRIPMIPGTQVQFQVEEATGRPLSVVIADGTSAMELSVFAAPKSNGLWDDVRTEILDSLHAGNGFGEPGHGPYGTEILMRLPTGNPRETVPGRMIGFDGPRWFLRAVVTGKAGADSGAAPLLDEVLRTLVVVRGEEAMPVRDPLPLRLPREMTGAPADEGDDGPGPPGAPASRRERVQLPARGVRTSEIR
jgi:hypothetical protein